MALLLVASSLALVGIGFAAGRYAGLLGVLAPIVIAVALGVGWEWQADALVFVFGAAILLGIGFALGLIARRRKHPIRSGLVQR